MVLRRNGNLDHDRDWSLLDRRLSSFAPLVGPDDSEKNEKYFGRVWGESGGASIGYCVEKSEVVSFSQRTSGKKY